MSVKTLAELRHTPKTASTEIMGEPRVPEVIPDAKGTVEILVGRDAIVVLEGASLTRLEVVGLTRNPETVQAMVDTLYPVHPVTGERETVKALFVGPGSAAIRHPENYGIFEDVKAFFTILLDGDEETAEGLATRHPSGFYNPVGGSAGRLIYTPRAYGPDSLPSIGSDVRARVEAIIASDLAKQTQKSGGVRSPFRPHFRS